MADRFDWNQWLMTIPGVPADWPKTAQADEFAQDDEFYMELPKAA